MKIRHVFLTLILMGLLSACRMPFAAVTATPTSTPSLTATKRPTETVTITQTKAPSRTIPPTDEPTGSRTPKPSATVSPTPTSPYPVNLNTPIPNPGFVEIVPENASKMIPVLQFTQRKVWTSAISQNGKQLFVATNQGIFVYDRDGKQISHWESIILPSQPCQSCLSINTDGSRFAMMTNRAGKWLAQIYNVYENNPALLLEKPIDAKFQGIANEVNIALSPNGLMLAYGTLEGDVLLTDVNNSQVLLTSKGGASSISFTPNGDYFAVRRGHQMLLWKIPTWKKPISLLLPSNNAPYTFSPDGKRMAVAQTDKITAYTLDTLSISRAIPIKTPKDLERNWQIAFINGDVLAGYSERWDADHLKATVEISQWNLGAGDVVQSGTFESDSPDALSALWGINLPPAPLPVGLVAISSEYNAFRFVDQDRLLVNSQHSACWLKITSGETDCHNYIRYKVLSSNTDAYRQFAQSNSSRLMDWDNNLVYTVLPPYPFVVVNQTGDYYLINAKNATTDVYFKGKDSAIESLPGKLLTYVENEGNIVFNTIQKSGQGMISFVNKPQLETIYQKKIDFMLKPLAVNDKNQVFFLQQGTNQLQQITLKVIDVKSYAITDLTHLDLPAEPEVMSISKNGIFAFGMKDGSVAIASNTGQQVTIFQATYSAIIGISFTPDGRYLAIACTDGIRVFAVLP